MWSQNDNNWLNNGYNLWDFMKNTFDPEKQQCGKRLILLMHPRASTHKDEKQVAKQSSNQKEQQACRQ